MIVSLGDALLEMNNVFEALAYDVGHYQTLLGQSGHPEQMMQLWRRSLTRATFALFEGTAYVMGYVAIAAAEGRKIDLREAEVSFLRGYRAEINAKGELIETRAKVSTLPNVKFAMNIFAKAHSVDKKLIPSQVEWNEVEKAIKIRDRLTHPKSSVDVTVTEDEQLLIQRVGLWFTQRFRVLLHSSVLIVANETPGGLDILRESNLL